MKSQIVTHKNLNNGNPVEIHYPISDSEFINQVSEIFEQEHYKEGKVKDGVYVDLGANIGLTALYFKDCAKEYYAVEPSSQCFEALNKNTQGLNIKLFNFAIWPREKEQYLYQTSEESTGQTFFANGSKAFGRELVQCKRIDTFFEDNKIEHVDVLKIDVESSEYIILPDDSFSRVADKIDLIIGEGHFDSMTGAIPNIIPIILKDYGFETRFTDTQNMIYKFCYTQEKGDKKTYEYTTNTMFVARRKK